jgi:hypothetical protein
MDLEQKSKQDIWQQHINDWRQSRLSQREYCKQNDISFSSFGYWRTRLNRSSKIGGKLIPVTVVRPSASVAVFLPGGLRLEVPSHALADVLPIVCRTVQAYPG